MNSCEKGATKSFNAVIQTRARQQKESYTIEGEWIKCWESRDERE